MKAPDKIWLTTDDNNGYVFTQKRTDNKGIEYIRKDALVEWANLQIKALDHFLHEKYSPMELGQRVMLVRLVDKLNSL